MGYRSTFVTEHVAITWPEWFVLKYHEHVFFNTDFSGSRGVIASKAEGKFYAPGVGIFGELVSDVERVCTEVGMHEFKMVVMYEDGQVEFLVFNPNRGVRQTKMEQA